MNSKPNSSLRWLTAIAKTLWTAVPAWFRNGSPSRGAAIAYYTLFALAPIILVVTAIAGLVFGQAAVQSAIVQQIAGLIGQEGAVAVEAILQRAREPRDGLAATVLGVAGLLFATTGAFLELQSALNRIWLDRSPDTSGLDVRALVTRRLRSLGVVMTIGFLLLVSLVVSAALGAASSRFGALPPPSAVVVHIAHQLVSLGITTVLFGTLLIVLPDVRLRWADVRVGALVTAVLFSIGQWLIGLYLGSSAIASPFGAAGTVAIVLVWVYYSAQILLYGAEFTRAWGTRNTTAMGHAVHLHRIESRRSHSR